MSYLQFVPTSKHAYIVYNTYTFSYKYKQNINYTFALGYRAGKNKFEEKVIYYTANTMKCRSMSYRMQPATYRALHKMSDAFGFKMIRNQMLYAEWFLLLVALHVVLYVLGTQNFHQYSVLCSQQATICILYI